MAYTYNDFVTAANNAGLMGSFSDDDLKIATQRPEYGLSMLKLHQDAQNAATAEQKLLVQEAMNQIRSSYGGMTPTTQGGSFQYGNETVYQKALNDVVNQGSFTYDPTKDPQYGTLKKTYLREGDRAMQDTMAAASAASGGMPSTYAITAAQQANDYYNTQFADIVPTLQQNAYSRYLSDFDQKLQQLGAMQNDRGTAWNNYLMQYEQEQAKKLQAAELMAGVGDYSLLGEYLGLTPEQLARLQGGGSGSGGGTGGAGTYGGIYDEQQLINDATALIRSEYPLGEVTSQDDWDFYNSVFGPEILAKIGIHQPVKSPFWKEGEGK